MAMTADLCDVAFREIRLGNLDRARASFQQAREKVVQESWGGLLPSICVVGAALVSAEGDHRQAAVLVGVAHTAFLNAGQMPDPGEAVVIAATYEAAVTALGAEDFAAEFSRGRESGPSPIVFEI